LEMYKIRPSVRAVVHVHPPHAIVFASARRPIPAVTVSAQAKVKQGPIVPAAPGGSDELAASILHGPGHIGVEDRELHVGPDDVLVRTHLAGICGTDKNIYQGRLPRMTGPGYGRIKRFSTPRLFFEFEPTGRP
jgi:Class II Aldolase and Adducin N-terminal domain